MLGEETKKQFETSAGMNFLAGVLLMYLPSEADAYGALVVLMQHRHMRELYKQDLAWLQVGAPSGTPAFRVEPFCRVLHALRALVALTG